MEDIEQSLQRIRRQYHRLSQCTEPQIQAILHEIADQTIAQTDLLLTQNALDLAQMDRQSPKYDRLMLTLERLHSIADDLRKVADMPTPLGKVMDHFTRPNGLYFEKITVPLGVLGIVFESRPNVTFDVTALCLKSGNAVVLKGSRDAHFSNIAIVALIQGVLKKYDLADLVYLAPSERAALEHILKANQYIDAIIPRGSAELIRFVRQHATVPVIETGAGIVHVYMDSSGALDKGKAIIENSKARRISVCNALDTLVIHRHRLGDLPALLENLGTQHHCQVYADPAAYTALAGQYPAHLLTQATDAHFGTEFLSMQLSVKTVDDIEEALAHIDLYGSKHSEAIVAEDLATANYFLQRVDAAVVYANAATSFTDGGEFGFGAEIGISTQKLHARGPMALPELCSYKWVVRGNGQVR